jgi:hypothetical protein
MNEYPNIGGIEKSSQETSGTKIEKEIICSLCGRRGHSVGQCDEIENLGEKDEIYRKRFISDLINKIERSGVGSFGEKISDLIGVSKQEKSEEEKESERESLRNSIVKYYGLDDEELFAVSPSGEKVRVFMDKNPIDFDKNFNQYVIRYSLADKDGKSDGKVRVNSVDALGRYFEPKKSKAEKRDVSDDYGVDIKKAA